ncbi:MAG TPA: MBL fold metallo-hydrolase [Acidimicrobiia bacterium]|nr:MBL fold metallo-hydrolase [Acidimicrobiia bacterium]
MDVTFYGVRGSTPCDHPAQERYGGNTSCVAIEGPGSTPIVFDLGTGLRYFGAGQPADGTFQGAVLLSHLHWDHMQGLPFFTPIDRPGARLDIYGPEQAEGPLDEVFTGIMRPPYFPVTPYELRGTIEFHDCGDSDFEIDGRRVMSRWVRHNGPTLGWRVDWNGHSVSYIPDHGPGTVPEDADDHVPRRIRELCEGVDILIHDAQYSPEEYEQKRHFGHCTVQYAVHVAREAGAKRLVMFHHDPYHDDEEIDRLLDAAREEAAGAIEVLAAYEGMVINFDEAHHGDGHDHVEEKRSAVGG